MEPHDISIMVMFNEDPMAMARGYEPGDPLKVIAVTVVRVHPSMKGMLKVADELFGLFNIGQERDQAPRSMSFGDVLVFGATAISCERGGWALTTIG